MTRSLLAGAAALGMITGAAVAQTYFPDHDNRHPSGRCSAHDDHDNEDQRQLGHRPGCENRDRVNRYRHNGTQTKSTNSTTTYPLTDT